MNIARILERSAYYFPDRPALSADGVEIPYGRLNEDANRVATGLVKLGISPGDPVALCAPNSPDWITFYFGALKAGAVAVTLSNLLAERELDLVLCHATPRIIFTSDDRLDALEAMTGPGRPETIVSSGGDVSLRRLMKSGTAAFQAIDRQRDDTAAVLFTGGTTGVPKGVMLSHENIYTAIQNVAFNERSNEKDRAICFLPFNHVFAQMHIMNATILSGGCVEMIPAFDLERVLEATAAGRITKLFGVPTIYGRLLEVDHIREMLGAVRYCFSAAASMATERVRQWKTRTDLSIHEAYGMTETASMVTYNHYYRHVIGSVGTPVGSTEVRIVDPEGNPLKKGEVGEICIRGRNVMTGYLDLPDETRSVFRGDWLRSGDMGTIDRAGYLFIVDRLKDMIITGGENVYPREIEELLYARPEIQECSVIGLPDGEWGERVTALITPSPGKTVNTKKLRESLKTMLSPYKVPKEYRIVEELPKSATGKILKRTLRQQILTNEGLGEES